MMTQITMIPHPEALAAIQAVRILGAAYYAFICDVRGGGKLPWIAHCDEKGRPTGRERDAGSFLIHAQRHVIEAAALSLCIALELAEVTNVG